MAGIDLHGNNLVIGVIDEKGKRLACQRLECQLEPVVKFLRPYKARLGSMAVESTFNWYWLVDGLQARGYPIDLANPAKIEQYSGLKHADDQHDAFHLAELQRLNILPKAHIYDAQLRPVRDLLRRRTNLVQERTALMLSFKSLYNRTTGETLPLARLKALTPKEAPKLYAHPANQLIAQIQVEHIEALDRSVARIEGAVLKCARAIPLYERLLTLPGVGKILGMTITMEVGDIRRFASDGDWASYCRLVDARRLSNGKCKGENNAKCGNKYLAWAFVEAANCVVMQKQRYAQRHVVKLYERLHASKNHGKAAVAVARHLAEASWWVLTKKQGYREPAPASMSSSENGSAR